ncbi:MAG TPA: cytochrome b N-terminal domain-containing protein [Thermodesulfovibrionales bacterium]|nr:cytochrome b N-terminal domain-containing protein [Thermodesulfovibrionales bacterium]
MLSGIWLWLNDRWPISSLMRLALDEEIPGGSRVAYTLGSTLLTVFALQATTGILQLFFYVPTVDHAYDSVSFLRTQVPFGWLINGLHYWGANAMVVLVLLHLARIFIWGAYKRPRELTWLFGVTLLLVVMALSFTGGPLSWDQRAYWEAEVGTSIPGSIPVVGDMIKQVMRGGEEMGQLTLSRLFIVHTTILPVALVVLILAHLIAFRRFGSVGPWNEAQRAFKGWFWPEQVFKDALMGTLVVLTLITLTVFLPKPFNGQADPLDSSFIPKPEWNFLFLYEALKFFPGRLEPIGSVGVPQVLILLLVLLPFVDRGPERNPLKRPVAMAFGIALAGAIVALTIAGYYSSPSAAPVSSNPAQTAYIASVSQGGSELFKSQGCSGCHRINNEGGTIGPDLSQEGSSGRTRDWLTSQIRNPKGHSLGSIMPAFTALSDRQLNDIVDYLLTLKAANGAQVQSPSPPASAVSPTAKSTDAAQRGNGQAADIVGSADRGELLFKMECQACHGPLGKDKVPNPGSTDGTVPPLNPVDRELYNRDPAQFARNIDMFLQHGSVPEGPGPQLRMPAFGDSNSLTQQQISNAEAYILSLNGIDRAEVENPGMPPKRFFIIVVPAVLLVLLILGGIYKCLP